MPNFISKQSAKHATTPIVDVTDQLQASIVHLRRMNNGYSVRNRSNSRPSRAASSQMQSGIAATPSLFPDRRDN